MDEDLKRKLDESIRKWEARPRYGELSPGSLLFRMTCWSRQLWTSSSRTVYGATRTS